MTAKNPQKQGRILEAGGGIFFWPARIYTPVLLSAQSLLDRMFMFDSLHIQLIEQKIVMNNPVVVILQNYACYLVSRSP